MSTRVGESKGVSSEAEGAWASWSESADGSSGESRDKDGVSGKSRNREGGMSETWIGDVIGGGLSAANEGESCGEDSSDEGGGMGNETSGKQRGRDDSA